MCWCWDEERATSAELPGVGTPVVDGVLRVSTLDFSGVLVGSMMLLGGLIAIVARELGSHPERRLVSPIRDGAEVLLPIVGAVVLVASVWISVS